MNYPQFVGFLLVTLGSVFMAASIYAGYKTKKDVPLPLAKNWLILSVLMVAFLIGYITFIFLQIYNIQFPLDLFVSIIFFAGGFFVFLAINLSRTTIIEINAHASNLAKMNETLEKQIQERTNQLRRANTELGQIFNTVTDGMRIIDKNATIIQINKTFEKLIGLPENEIIGRKCSEIFPGTACNTANCPLICILQGQNHIEIEAEKKDHTGKLISCLVTATPHRNPEGELIGIIETFKNITPYKQMEQELIASLSKSYKLTDELQIRQKELHEKNLQIEKAFSNLQKAQSHILQQEKMASIGQLAAGVAHEINNPMGFISSNLRTLKKYMEKFTECIETQEHALQALHAENQAKEIKRKLKLDFLIEDTKELLEESMDGAKRVSEIVKTLKTFSRVDEAQYQEVDINECLDSTIKVIWNELKYKAKVIREYGELPPVKCYPQELSQVFMNIFMNAIHAIEDHGKITIRTWQEKNLFFIAISDTGKGIPAANLTRLFEPFFTTREVGKGTGLGLSISHEIIQKHKGEIHVVSAVGKGSTFTIQLPLV
jgi:PAS domain S-box-containing protein